MASVIGADRSIAAIVSCLLHKGYIPTSSILMWLLLNLSMNFRNVNQPQVETVPVKREVKGDNSGMLQLDCCRVVW